MIRFDLDHPTLRLAGVRALPVRCEPSPGPLLAEMRAAEEQARRQPTASQEGVRRAIRDVLRVGGYQPSGRGKPASEFLLATARDRGLPIVNNLVDINNLVSLRTGLPISMFDADRLQLPAVIRFGRPGENYVFNNSGQTMDVAGIPVVCRVATDQPIGNAVKDSMVGKVNQDSRDVLAVVYGSSSLPGGLLEEAARQLQALLLSYAFAEACEWALFPANQPSLRATANIP